MTISRTFRLSTAQEFQRFALDRRGDADFTVFVSTQNLDNGGYRTLPDLVQRYTLHLPFAEGFAEVYYVAVPRLPFEWEHATGQRIEQKFGHKTELLRYLRETLHADPARLSAFAKVTKNQLQQFIDASGEDAEEVTHRTVHDKDTEILVPVAGLGLTEVRVDIKKQRSDIEYRLSADYSAPWAAVRRDTDEMLAALKNEFKIYETIE